MTVLDQVRLIVYRFHEKGLEILMIKREGGDWTLPGGEKVDIDFDNNEVIELEAIEEGKGKVIKGMAVEGDWHEIPSIRGLIKSDIALVKGKIKEKLPELEQGTYMMVKDAFKRVLPNEYALLKELKDILFDRNLLRNI